MACLLKYENRKYTIVTKETSDQCVIFKKGSSLPPLKGLVINTPQLCVPLSSDIYDMHILEGKDVYKIDVRKTLKLDQLYEILKFETEIVSIPFVCKKHFSKKCFTKWENPTTNFISHMRLVSTPDNKNETLEITVGLFRLPKKIKGYKVIKLGEEIIVSTKTIVGDVSKFETRNDISSQSVDTASRITKRKFEVPYPIKLAAGIITFFGVLEIGSALISKVVNKIK